MRIELPTRIAPAKTLVFATTLFCVQQLEHTSIVFSVLFFAFVMVGNLAFNAGGGFSRVSGAYVFLFSVLTCILGVTWKACVGEPADSNLLVPQLDMAIYAASNVMLLIVILINKRLAGRSHGLATGEINYSLAALGCFILGLLELLFNVLGLGGSGSLLGVANQLNQFAPLSVILGTIGAMRDSGGRRSVSFISGTAMLVIFLLSMVGFTKQGMFEPIACWLVAAAFSRFKLRPVHYVVLAVFAVASYVIVPLIAEGRSLASPNAGYAERAAIVYTILTHLGEAKQAETIAAEHVVASQGKSGYYNHPQGFIERLSILSTDDTLLNFTAQGNYVGYRPVIENYENFIPHFLFPNKPIPYGGNYYAHEIGAYVADADESTGISFSCMAEAFHIDGWVGIFFVLPAVWLSLFFVLDAICGDIRRSPWGLLMVVYLAHAAAESLLGGLIWTSFFGSLGLVFAIFFCTQFAPIVGALFYGGDHPGDFILQPLYVDSLWSVRRLGVTPPPAPRNL